LAGRLVPKQARRLVGRLTPKLVRKLAGRQAPNRAGRQAGELARELAGGLLPGRQARKLARRLAPSRKFPISKSQINIFQRLNLPKTDCPTIYFTTRNFLISFPTCRK